ncbi:MAG TPA: hypothetical protein VFS51_08810 [Gemmatimonadales bacterium]|nr:hypothetical protein [Gemmatimonadales bacterium]
MPGQAPTRWRARALTLQSVYYLVTGLWPVIHFPSFEAVTGPKTDDWLVHTVGVLAAAIGLSLGVAVVRAQTQAEPVTTLAIASALAFAGIDLVYGLSGRISPIYLVDAGVQFALVLVLSLTTRSAREPPVSPRMGN